MSQPCSRWSTPNRHLRMMSTVSATRWHVIADSIANVGGWAHALFNEPVPLEAFATLDVPVLYMIGGRSPPSSRSVARSANSSRGTDKTGSPRHLIPVGSLYSDVPREFQNCG